MKSLEEQGFDFRFVKFFVRGRDGRISAIFKKIGQNLTKIWLKFDQNLFFRRKVFFRPRLRWPKFGRNPFFQPKFKTQ